MRSNQLRFGLSKNGYPLGTVSVFKVRKLTHHSIPGLGLHHFELFRRQIGNELQILNIKTDITPTKSASRIVPIFRFSWFTLHSHGTHDALRNSGCRIIKLFFDRGNHNNIGNFGTLKNYPGDQWFSDIHWKIR